MRTKAMRELSKCMKDLGIDTARQLRNKVDAWIFNPSSKARGDITVTFHSNWSSSDGPYIEFDETIRGFGLNHAEYRPRWVDMRYDKSEKCLTVSHEGYEFTLTFG